MSAAQFGPVKAGSQAHLPATQSPPSEQSWAAVHVPLGAGGGGGGEGTGGRGPIVPETLSL